MWGCRKRTCQRMQQQEVGYGYHIAPLCTAMQRKHVGFLFSLGDLLRLLSCLRHQAGMGSEGGGRYWAWEWRVEPPPHPPPTTSSGNRNLAAALANCFLFHVLEGLKGESTFWSRDFSFQLSQSLGKGGPVGDSGHSPRPAHPQPLHKPSAGSWAMYPTRMAIQTKPRRGGRPKHCIVPGGQS